MERLANYSQNFICNPQLIKELLTLSSIKYADTVYDIGAGSGVISSVLANKCHSVVAIEIDPRIADKLRENMSKYSNVTVREGDFLNMPAPSGKYKIFSNIPFHLSSLILHKITESTNPPDIAYLIVQKQFAEKLVPNANRFTGQLGILIGPEFTVSIRRRLKKTDFWPHPNVDTVFIEIKHRANPLINPAKMPTYRKYIVGCFSDPKIFTKTPRDRVGLPLDIKPSQMTLSQWIELFTNDINYK